MHRIFLLPIAVFALISAAFAHQGATGIVKERMDRFAQSRTDLKSSFTDLKAGQFDAVIAKARTMAEWGRDMPSYFPDGSDGAPSEAAAAIWQDKDGFTAAANVFADAADHVIITAQTGDAAATGAALKKLGATCGACHRKYRLK